MKRLLREPLLHFLILGALLFALYGWLNRGAMNAANEIVVTPGQQASIRVQFARIWQRQPTPEEMQGLLDQWVRDEIYYREGVAMGLSQDDPVVRRRVAQKLEFVADGSTPAAPTDAELQAWLAAHADRYRIEPRYSLRQIYFDPARHGQRLEADAAAARVALNAGKGVEGDSTLLPHELDAAQPFEVARAFGNPFAEALKDLPVGSWQGPVASGFGVHLVKLDTRDGGRPARLDEVRDAVERDLLRERSEQTKADFYAGLRANYRVRVEPEIAVPEQGAPGAPK